MPAVVEWRKPTTLTMIAASVAPASGIRSRMRDDEAEGDGVRDAEHEQHGGGDDARDQADREVAGDVAADRAVDVAADLAPARLGRLRQQAVDPLDPRRPLEQHEQRQERDRDDGDDGVENALRQREGGVREAEDAAGAALLDRLACPLDDVVLALEEAEPAAPAGEVVDVAGNGVGQVVDLAHEGRHERRGDPDDDEDRADEDDADCRPALHPTPDEELDGRVERHREEERDQQPDDHRARHPDHLEHDRDGEHDPDHGQDRARPEPNDALVEHPARIGAALDGSRDAAVPPADGYISWPFEPARQACRGQHPVATELGHRRVHRERAPQVAREPEVQHLAPLRQPRASRAAAVDRREAALVALRADEVGVPALDRRRPASARARRAGR